ncbi:MAG TPA: methylated-DNA--[protein]-cysteine S-methyltransferase [Firmicutes bacterium]|nr:methylated-DNA--[protein]-cysteine S-methyltransferase [Bacillota bacterium]
MDNTGAFSRIFAIAAAIPPGRVASYGQIAALAGNPRLARRVGQALSRPPAGIPCHRVVKKDGALPPEHVFSGLQRPMLEAEGVRFLPDGRVDMERCRWRPEEGEDTWTQKK